MYVHAHTHAGREGGREWEGETQRETERVCETEREQGSPNIELPSPEESASEWQVHVH